MFQKIHEDSGRNHLLKIMAKYEGNGGVEKLSALSGISQVENFSRVGESFTTFLFRSTDAIAV